LSNPPCFLSKARMGGYRRWRLNPALIWDKLVLDWIKKVKFWAHCDPPKGGPHKLHFRCLPHLEIVFLMELMWLNC